MITFETRYLRYSIDEQGNNFEFVDKATGRNLLKKGFNPCGKMVTKEKEGVELYPVRVSYQEPYLTVAYPEGRLARILVGVHDTYLTFALEQVSDEDFWSIATTLIQVDIDYTTDCSFVASLMGMTLNTRMCEYPGRNNCLQAEGYTHIFLEGVKAAVIGAPESELNGIMRQVLDEIPDGTMPKAAYSGPYAKECPDAGRTYTVTSQILTLENIDDYIDKMEKFAITQIHMHQGNMYYQGDFSVNPESYPGGIDEFKAVITRMHERGIQAILHTYSFCVQHVGKEVGNKYLAPIPHKDLGVYARYTLAQELAEQDDFVPTVENTEQVSTEFGFYVQASDLLWIDDEIIRFAGVDRNGFTKIQRGVFGTTISSHKAGSQIRQINSYFNYIMPEVGSELFYEIARNTAEFYNYCDFDGYYLDAIDGVFVLDGNEFAWYHGVDFINEVFKFQIKPPIFNCCYGSQYPGQWYARTRMGCFDMVTRGYRDFIDAQVKENGKFAESMYLIPEMGWKNLYPGFNDKLGWANKVMFDEDVEYLCSKTLATDACQGFLGNFIHYPSIPIMAGYSDKIRLYTKLKEENYFDSQTKAMLRRPASEYELVEKEGEYYFRPTYTDFHKIQSLEEGRNTFCAVNKFSAQAPRIRMEALYTADCYDSPEGQVLCEIDQERPVPFGEPLSLSCADTNGKRGIGVWIMGDGRGETVCMRLESPEHIAHGYSDHYIKVDFTGWRYYSFYEFENCERRHEDWAPTQMDYHVFTDSLPFYAVYSEEVAYDRLESLTVLVNRPGDYDIRMKSVHILPHKEIVLKRPTLIIGDQRISFAADLKSNTFLEYDPINNQAVVYDMAGHVLDRPAVLGAAPILEEGENTVTFIADCKEPYQKRVAVTLCTAGEVIRR
ncbi:MAG: hypothetical protein E7293_02775 [Lachnospiraceae bacterium]|nr:hypothetical protein [Lachnospiraceae bacterium]